MIDRATTSQDAQTARLAYSINAAAAEIDISPRMLRGLISEGKLRATRIGRRLLVPAAELEKLIAVAQ